MNEQCTDRGEKLEPEEKASDDQVRRQKNGLPLERERD